VRLALYENEQNCCEGRIGEGDDDDDDDNREAGYFHRRYISEPVQNFSAF